MAEIYKERWYKIDFKNATYYTESAGFTRKPFDLFDYETQIYFHPQTNLQFKFKQGQGDTIGFYISPYLGEKPITFEEFEKVWNEYGKREKVDTLKEF